MTVINCSYVSVRELLPYAKNTRHHTKKQIDQVAHSILKFGFLNPVVIDKNNIIIAGHCRVLAAQKLGIEEITAIRADHLSEVEMRAYRLADNKLAENSTWNEEALKHELEFLSELNFDVELTGFEIAEIYMLLDFDTAGEDKVSNHIPKPPDETIVLHGDIFTLGRHRQICGDCRDKSHMNALMNGQQANLVCSDSPFNVKINGHVITKAQSHSEFTVASGELSMNEFIDFLKSAFKNFYDSSTEGSIHYHFMDWRHMSEILSAGNEVYDKLLNLCVWAKTNAGMGSFYRSQHELVFVFKKGKDTHQNNVQLGKFGRSRSNLWTYAGMNSFGNERDELLAQHPTVKPVSMIADIILDASKPNDIVLDGFLGSGTTIIAAEQTKRVCYGVEIDPKYVEVCIQRFKAVSDQPVIHTKTGMTFTELKQYRLSQNREEKL